MIPLTGLNVDEAIFQIREATAARKCWTCGCFHSSLEAIQEELQEESPGTLRSTIDSAKKTLRAVKYDCIGCEICHPAIAINALEIEADACPTEEAEEREGWPPLPGDYTVCRYQSPVAVCTLTDTELAERLTTEPEPEIAVVGTMHTENLGIERVILNVLANPNIRFLILCGLDSRKPVGHLPGQSMVAMAHNGLDESSRIVGARGKRPQLRNIGLDAVEHFRRTVDVVDLVGCVDADEIRSAVKRCALRNPGPAEPFEPERVARSLEGYLPSSTVPDPAGYFVVYVNRDRKCLSLEHYTTDGAINAIIEGRTAAEIYTPAVDTALVSRLDHAAYLGKELARAEQALQLYTPYIQDAAPERPTGRRAAAGCGCESTCPEESC